MYIDTSDFTRMAEKYRSRSQNISTNPFGPAGRAEISADIMDLLSERLDESEGITIDQEKAFYADKKVGVYGGGFGELAHDKTKVNPQERLPNKAKILGTGRLFADASVVSKTKSGIGTDFTLQNTRAMMTPYDEDVPTKSLVYYLRHGWRGLRAHMIPRPMFFRSIAFKGLMTEVLSKRISLLLSAAGFIRKG